MQPNQMSPDRHSMQLNLLYLFIKGVFFFSLLGNTIESGVFLFIFDEFHLCHMVTGKFHNHCGQHYQKKKSELGVFLFIFNDKPCLCHMVTSKFHNHCGQHITKKKAEFHSFSYIKSYLNSSLLQWISPSSCAYYCFTKWLALLTEQCPLQNPPSQHQQPPSCQVTAPTQL